MKDPELINVSSDDQENKNERKKKKIKKNKVIQHNQRPRIGKINFHQIQGKSVYYDVDMMRGDLQIGVNKLSSSQIKQHGREYVLQIIKYA